MEPESAKGGTPEEGRVQGVELPRPVNWLGRVVILNYTSGPFPEDLWEITIGELQARSGLFLLEEVGDWGILVRKIKEGGKTMPAVFMPWGSVQVMRPISEEDEEDEKREGMLSASGAASTQPPTQAAQERSTTKKRDRLNEVHEYIKENEELLEDPDLDSITNSHLASTSASLLKEISGEIREAGRNKGLPANKMRRLVKAYETLKPFVERAIRLYEERFGSETEADDNPGEAYSAVKEAERVLQEESGSTD